MKSENYAAAGEKYRDALGRLEQLMLREKPGEEEWKDLLNLKIPLLLNLAQCRYKNTQRSQTVMYKSY